MALEIIVFTLLFGYGYGYPGNTLDSVRQMVATVMITSLPALGYGYRGDTPEQASQMVVLDHLPDDVATPVHFIIRSNFKVRIWNKRHPLKTSPDILRPPRPPRDVCTGSTPGGCSDTCPFHHQQ